MTFLGRAWTLKRNTSLLLCCSSIMGALRMLLIALAFYSKPVTAVSVNCSAGNTQVAMERIPSSIGPGLYIDTDNPAPCTGQLTAWNYCYYEPNSGNRIDVSFQLHIWRLDLSTNMYRKVGERNEAFRIRRGIGRFRCDTIELQESDYIDIERGDLLGVSLGTPSLFLVADTEGTQHLLFTDAAIQDRADSNDLEVVAGRSLHISADIAGDQLQFETTTTAFTTATTRIPLPSSATERSLATTSGHPNTNTNEDTTDGNRAGTDEGASERESNPSLGPGAVAGIAVGLIILLVCGGLILLGIVLYIKKRGKATSTKDPHSYDLPPIDHSLNSAHRSSHSTRRPWYTLGPVGRRIANWFNDSFEDENHTHAHLSTNSHNETSAAVEVNLYESVDEALTRCNIYPEDTNPANQGDEAHENVTNETEDVTIETLNTGVNTIDIYSFLDEVHIESSDTDENRTFETSNTGEFSNDNCSTRDYGAAMNPSNQGGDEDYDDVTIETFKLSENVSSNVNTGDMYTCLDEISAKSAGNHEDKTTESLKTGDFFNGNIYEAAPNPVSQDYEDKTVSPGKNLSSTVNRGDIYSCLYDESAAIYEDMTTDTVTGKNDISNRVDIYSHLEEVTSTVEDTYEETGPLDIYDSFKSY